MNVRLQVFDSFGAFCVDAALATQIRSERVDPFLNDAEQILFDFEGVRNMNSSFCNALIANLVTRHPEFLTRIKFANCRSNLKVLIQSAVDLGLERVQNQTIYANSLTVVVGS